MPPLHAVLTGDLIGSTQAGRAASEAAMQALALTARDVALWPGSSDPRFTRSRGDGWQMLLSEPALALRATCVLQASLRALTEAIPTRISIAIGRVESLGTTDLSDAGGPAFTASGQGLDRIAAADRLAIICGARTPFAQALASLADALMRGWTREQAEAVALALQPHHPTLAEMATKLRISRQAVNYRLAGANLRALRSATEDWETSFKRNLVDGV